MDVDYAISLFLVFDVVRSLARGPHRWRYLWTRGWLDLLGSMPVAWFPLFRILRLVRLGGLIQQLRKHGTWQRLQANGAENTLYVTIFSLFLLIITASIVVFHTEQNAIGSNIKNPGDALWWAVVTVTTVGYGDHYPVTALGRIVATVLMVSGVGLFGVISSYLTSTFLRNRHSEEAETSELAQVQAELAEVKRILLELRSSMPAQVAESGNAPSPAETP